jgi:phage terminase large subunit
MASSDHTDTFRRLQRVGRKDPVSLAQALFGAHLWSSQRAVVQSVWEHKRTAVRSCHGVGKTYTAAIVALTFLLTYPRSRVITTAPTFTQVENLLWREIHALMSRCEFDFGIDPSATKLELAPDWFAIGLSTDKPERFQGQHAEHILLIVDEASGVDDLIYEAGEGYLTSEHARLLLIGNPTQLAGQFHRAFHSERHLWNTIHISAHDSPNLSGEDVPDHLRRHLISRSWVEEKAAMWGVESAPYEVRVLGEFPSTADNTVMGLRAVAEAQRRVCDGETGPVVVSCDVARFGSDETVIALRQGHRVRVVETFFGKRTTHTAGACLRWAREHDADWIVVDDAGVGGGVTDALMEAAEFEVHAFNGAEQAIEADEYPNRRSEVWFAFADLLPTLDLDEDMQLAGDMTAPTYKLDSKGRRVVESKADTKKRLGRSPDRGDAVLMAYAPTRDRSPAAAASPLEASSSGTAVRDAQGRRLRTTD